MAQLGTMRYATRLGERTRKMEEVIFVTMNGSLKSFPVDVDSLDHEDLNADKGDEQCFQKSTS